MLFLGGPTFKKKFDPTNLFCDNRKLIRDVIKCDIANNGIQLDQVLNTVMFCSTCNSIIFYLILKGVMKRAACRRPRKRQPLTLTS